MSEYRRLCVERAMELARDPRLTAWQISQRTGVSERECRRFIREERHA